MGARVEVQAILKEYESGNARINHCRRGEEGTTPYREIVSGW
jgi:hypothetical protein